MEEVNCFFTPTRDFASSLGGLARQAFSEMFEQLYEPAPFQQFLDEAYGPGWQNGARLS